MSEETESVEGWRSWTNGFTLKKTTSGYSWTISIAARDQSLQALHEAVDEASKLDTKLQKMYGNTEIKARLR